MNVSSATTFATTQAAGGVNQPVTPNNAKKAQALQQQNAVQAPQALPQPVSNNPANLGTRIDTRA